MNKLLILRLAGIILLISVGFMVPSFIVSVIYNESVLPFVLSAGIIVALCVPAVLFLRPKSLKFRSREGLAGVAVAWICVCIAGALPFLFCGRFSGFADCLFESVSGFTTTGMSVFSDVESLPKGILLWRSSIQWMGGMGILAFLLAVLPSADASMFTLFSAESTGPTSSAKKITPRVKDTAKIVYLIYILMTVLLAILLAVVGIAPFDAIVCSLSAISTGGFSSMNASVGSFGNVAANMLVALFTFLAGVNFSVYFLFAVKEFKSVLKDEEVRFYCLSSGIICLIMIIDLIAHHIDFFTALENSVFLSAAVVSTAGFSAVSPNIWSTTTQIIVVIFSIIGSSSGSTGGGVKGIRVLIMMKSLKNEILKMINPKVIKTVSINGKTVDDTVVSKVAKFFFIYMFILLIGSLIISFDQKDFLTCFSVILASLSNAWTAIPTNIADFYDFSVLSKSAMMFSMIAGRLEFFPLLALFTPSVWKSK